MKIVQPESYGLFIRDPFDFIEERTLNLFYSQNNNRIERYLNKNHMEPSQFFNQYPKNDND